jgi:transcriptional regulator with XRE-family HTH domain
MTDFAARLKKVRESAGMTPYRLAQLTGLSKQGALNLEQPGADPKLSTLVKLAEALGVNVRDLLPGASVNSDGPSVPETIKFRGNVIRPNKPEDFARVAKYLLPLLTELVKEAKKDRVEISLSHLCALAGKIKLLFVEQKEGFAEIDYEADARARRAVEAGKGRGSQPKLTSSADGCLKKTEALPLIEECIDILKKPEVGRQTTLALDHLWRVQQMLKGSALNGETAEASSLIKKCINLLTKAGSESRTNLALDHLGKVQKTLRRLNA